jgi:ComF family protein
MGSNLDPPDMLRALAHLMPPARCAVCGLAAGDPLCTACEDDYFPQLQPRCTRCALPLSTEGVCGRCLSEPPHFDATTALADYASPVAGMVMALKFSARLDLARVFGRLLAHRVPPSNAATVAVPLAYERAAERGFNQSQLIARAFCAARGTAPVNVLRRIRHAPPQQSLKFDARRKNIRGAFAAIDGVGAHVFVVDDVMTTGSTLDEIARVLKQAGATHVHNLVVARTR